MLKSLFAMLKSLFTDVKTVFTSTKRVLSVGLLSVGSFIVILSMHFSEETIFYITFAPILWDERGYLSVYSRIKPRKKQEIMKQNVSISFMLLGIMFNVCLIAANLLETKVIQLGSLTVTAGLLVFPVSYIINDCISEVWGFRKARLIIWSGFAMNFFVVALGLVAVSLPAAPFWEGEEHFNFVFGMAPRIVVASLLAFLTGSFLNAYVMSRMKIASQGRRFAWRAIASTVVGETADSLIFFPIAFGGVIVWPELVYMMAVQVVLKSLYEILILPVTIRVVRAVKRVDGSDVYDDGISYKFWKIKEL